MKPEYFIHPDISKANTLPGKFYHSDDVYADIIENIFAKSWQWVGVDASVPAPGDVRPLLFLPGCLDEPLLLTKAMDEKIHCISNVCTHRGNILVGENKNCKEIRCRYHGRKFSLDGKFLSMPKFEEAEDFPGERDHLPKLPLANWGKFLFTSISPKWSAADWLKPVHDWMPGFEKKQMILNSSLTRNFSVNANWSLYCENYLEGFHIPFVHPELSKAIVLNEYETHLFPLGSLQIAYAKEGDPVLEFPPGHKYYNSKIAACYFFLFPNLMLNFYPWGLSINQVIPIAKDKTQIKFLSYVNQPALLSMGAGAQLEKVELEDEAIVESVQKGVNSRLYDRGRFSPSMEKGVHHFQRWMVETMYS